MTRVLLTGGTGFVGANLARRLIRDGHETHLLLREQSNCWRLEEIRNSLHLHVTDVRDLAATVRDIAPQWIFHLAAYGSYPQQTDFDRMVELLKPGGLLTMPNWFLLIDAITMRGHDTWATFAGPSWEAAILGYAEQLANDPRLHVTWTVSPPLAVGLKR